MYLKLKPEQSFSSDHREHLNLNADPVIPEKIIIFRRNEPAGGKLQLTGNIHSRYVLWICLNGCGSLMIDNISYVLKEGDAVITFPGQPHMRLPLAGQKVDWLLIRFSVREVAWLEILRSRPVCLPEKAAHYLQELSNCYLSASETAEDSIVANECTYYLGLMLNSMRMAESVDEALPLGDTRGNEYVRQVCRLVMSPEFAGRPFKDIARKVGITPGHLRTIFKEATGSSPKRFIQSYQISTIKNLLQHSSLNITQIAEKTGFDSVYSLSRFFSKICGISPRQYRNSYKNR